MKEVLFIKTENPKQYHLGFVVSNPSCASEICIKYKGKRSLDFSKQIEFKIKKKCQRTFSQCILEGDYKTLKEGFLIISGTWVPADFVLCFPFFPQETCISSALINI